QPLAHAEQRMVALRLEDELRASGHGRRSEGSREVPRARLERRSQAARSTTPITRRLRMKRVALVAALLPGNALAHDEDAGKGQQMNASGRDRDYLEAVAAYYGDYANRTERQRAVSRSQAYGKLAAKYPQDDEAQIFNALYLIAIQQASDQTYSNSLAAAGILEKQFAKYPNHPGVAHYLIHAYDAPPGAQKGLPSARRYA